jgi:signal transduction histidine kinase
MGYKIDYIIDFISQHVGMETAMKVVAECIEKSGLSKKKEYNEEELVKISSILKEKGSIFRVIANVLVSPEYKEIYYKTILEKEKEEKEELSKLLRNLENLYNELKVSYDELSKAKKALEEAQEQIIRQEKLATIGRLASFLSHEIRTPLASIKNCVYLLKKKLALNDDPKIVKYFGIMEKELETIDELITDVLDFARTTSLNKKMVLLRDIIEEMEKSLKISENIVFEKEVLFEDEINVDPIRIKQVLINIIKNAAQAIEGFRKEGGKIILKTALEVDKVKIEVIDNGCGMNEETRNKIFDILFTTKTKGTGLGMAIVKEIIDKHNGNIIVESEEGKGTKVTILLPLT